MRSGGVNKRSVGGQWEVNGSLMRGQWEVSWRSMGGQLVPMGGQ